MTTTRRPTPAPRTGLFAIPEGMAYASIAGFNPVAGLSAGIVPAIVGLEPTDPANAPATSAPCSSSSG